MLRHISIYTDCARVAKALIACAILALAATGAHAEARNGIAMHGEPLHGPDFKHFSYVNPDAPQGGTITFASVGSFDNLNPFIVKGQAAGGMRDYVYESLMARAYDEPFSLYGLLAESIETPPDRSWVIFHLRPQARFSDGKPVTAGDVIFSLKLLRDHGRPNHRSYYRKVSKIEEIDRLTVKLTFDADGDREMPLIMGLMPILPKHAIDPDTFERTTLKPPVGSGPYLVTNVKPGSRVTYERNPDYWGNDLAVNRGRFNFAEMRFEYFRDASAMFEAFKTGLYNVRPENDPGSWAELYNFPAVNDGRVVKDTFPIETPAGMQGLVFNTRRPMFADRRVREALILTFNFAWVNENLFHGLYDRTQSYFDRSELSSHGRPADAYEKKLLAPYPDAVTPEIMAGTYDLPDGDISGRNRRARRTALHLLDAAGWQLKGGQLINKKSGEPFRFEMLAATKDEERVFLTYRRSLETLGIDARIRQVDSSQFQQRKQTYDFDMIQNYWWASLSPGNEQTFRWGSDAARVDGTFNYAGVKSKAVDAMIQALLEAKSRDQFVSAVRALDRVLRSGSYVVPLYHLPKQWVARWAQYRHPDKTSLYGYEVDTWWKAHDERAAAH